MTEIEGLHKDLAAALPRKTKWYFHDTWVAFDFSRLDHPLLPVTQLPFTRPAPKEWSKYHLFGDELFENGSACICIDQTDGSIKRIDVELEEPIGLFNTGASQFVAAFKLLEAYFVSKNQIPDNLAHQLRLIDPQAFDTGSHWKLLSDYLK